MKRKTCTVWMLVLAGLAVSGCATLQVGSDYDRSASFTAYHFFTVMRRDHEGDARNPLVIQRADDAIRRELVAKGYVEATDPSRADFAVDFTIGSKERTDINSYPAPYDGPRWGWGPGWWGAGYWGDSLDVRQYREGTLSIDMFDARTHRPVWHGWAKK